MKDEFLRHRKGTVSLTMALFKNEIELMQIVFKDAVIFRAESMAITDTMEYAMIHPQFRAVDWGEVIPAYDIEIDQDDDGVVKSVNFIEKVQHVQVDETQD